MQASEIRDSVRKTLNLVEQAIDQHQDERWTDFFLLQLKEARIKLTEIDNGFR